MSRPAGGQGENALSPASEGAATGIAVAPVGFHGPFDPDDEAAYRSWRARKLDRYPAAAGLPIVALADPRALTGAERDALLDAIGRTNMAVYASPLAGVADKDIPRRLGRQLGLDRLDRNWLADDDGVSQVRVAEGGTRSDFIPYTDRPIRWHTDGYYNPPARRSSAWCCIAWPMRQKVGATGLLDHEIAYLLLRASPDFVRALMRPDAMTIPERIDDDGTARPAKPGRSSASIRRIGHAVDALHRAHAQHRLAPGPERSGRRRSAHPAAGRRFALDPSADDAAGDGDRLQQRAARALGLRRRRGCGRASSTGRATHDRVAAPGRTERVDAPAAEKEARPTPADQQTLRTIPIVPASPDEGERCSGGESYALMVLGDSMAPEFVEGEVIVVEPEGLAGDGSFVVAEVAGEPIFRRLAAQRRWMGSCARSIRITRRSTSMASTRARRRHPENTTRPAARDEALRRLKRALAATTTVAGRRQPAFAATEVQTNSVTSALPANSRNVAAPPYSMPSMNSLLSKSKRSTVIWQAISLTPASRHAARSSSSEATPCFLNFCFIIIVAIDLHARQRRHEHRHRQRHRHRRIRERADLHVGEVLAQQRAARRT